MAVAAFGVHLHDTWEIRELSVLYLAISLVFMFKGSGRLSLDSIIK
jgi:uncharacterized membrane protein YphA (DoxX/SURF4 family)